MSNEIRLIYRESDQTETIPQRNGIGSKRKKALYSILLSIK